MSLGNGLAAGKGEFTMKCTLAVIELTESSLSSVRTPKTTPQAAAANILVQADNKQALFSWQEMESKVILEDVNAVFKPSTTTLVLGPPGCGKVQKRNS